MLDKVITNVWDLQGNHLRNITPKTIVNFVFEANSTVQDLICQRIAGGLGRRLHFAQSKIRSFNPLPKAPITNQSA